ncbi:uncharacterized protein LOC130688377 [Daphnia carinata]|uniref:uncharacterized protein LOC130688377 n=1 Tax=Daphnia carinata TaxID=120202 RepID=UPI0025807CC1|nr:uncharacterized protein LOC130688377 [Daphnia carinata]
MKLHPFFTMSLFVAVLTIRVDSAKIRSKVRRSALSLPTGSSLTVTMDLIIPVVPLINTTLTYLWFDLPLTFDLPTASTLNELYVSLGFLPEAPKDDNDTDTSNELSHEFVDDQRANHDRRQIYQYAESFFQNFGLNGQVCVKRAICELAEAPLGSHGLFGKIFELLFLPSTTREVQPQFNISPINVTSLPVEFHYLGQSIEDDYTDAYLKGRKTSGCSIHFSACPISIFKLLDY